MVEEVQEALGTELDLMNKIIRVSHIAKHRMDEQLSQGLIEPSRSAYCSPVVIVDYIQLNEHLERDAYPVPKIVTSWTNSENEEH